MGVAERSTERPHLSFNMQTIVFATVLALAAAAPDRFYEAPGGRAASSEEFAHILRDDRHHGDNGEFRMEFETSNGIRMAQSGYGSGPNGAVEMQGEVEFTHPDGTPFALSFVASVCPGPDREGCSRESGGSALRKLRFL